MACFNVYVTVTDSCCWRHTNMSDPKHSEPLKSSASKGKGKNFSYFIHVWGVWMLIKYAWVYNQLIWGLGY